jgi:uncharacterized membrane protein YbhN (UPF0104 family)
MITPVVAHIACATLVTIDLAARTWRVHLLARTVGHPVGSADALRVNLLADAGASLSPMRLAGEPARIAGLAAAGVPLRGSLALIACELATAWPTLLGIGVMMVAIAAPAWWSDTGARLAGRATAALPAVAVVAALSLVAWLATAPLRRAISRRAASMDARETRSVRRIPVRALALSALLSAVNITTRTAVLPVLALTLADPPSPAALWFGSFVLVYGQLVLPTPAGVGAVELGFLGGAAGAGAGDVGLLLAWRWWTNGVPTLLGLAVAWQLRGRVAGILRPARAAGPLSG